MQKLAAKLTEKLLRRRLISPEQSEWCAYLVECKLEQLLCFFRADYARLPDCAAVESFTAELGRCVLAPQGKRVTLAYVLGLYAFLAVL